MKTLLNPSSLKQFRKKGRQTATGVHLKLYLAPGVHLQLYLLPTRVGKTRIPLRRTYTFKMYGALF
jgi:hypothetical protein